MLDYNGDMISDLMADECGGQRIVWQGNLDGTFDKVVFNTGRPLDEATADATLDPIRDPNANAFIDLNRDGIADIFVDSECHFEYWFSDANRKYGLNKPLTIGRPEKQFKSAVIGQSAFFDLNGDDRVEHIVPLCTTTSCMIVALNLTVDSTNSSSEWTRRNAQTHVFTSC